MLAKAKAAGRLDYDAPIEGLKSLDRYTLQITLKEPDYVLLGYLTQSTMAAVAREVIEAYGDASGWAMANPVGTGPFRLKEWRRGQKIVLEANPNFRAEYFPESGEPGDRDLIAKMKGKRLPQLGQIDISIIEESQPQLLAFASGELDYVNVPADLVANVLGPGNALKPEFADKGVTLHRVTQPALSYTYFNMEDPVVGGYTPDKIALRRAMIMGFNTEEMIRVWWQGQALVASQPIPPGVAGHNPGFVARAPYDPAAAKALLDKFGYVDRDKDGWRELPDGKPLTIVMASTPTGRDRERDELWKKNMTALGIRIDFMKQKWPDLLKMGRAGKLQMWPVGWINTYGEGDAFMQLLYSKNIGQSNYSRFALPEYDELYRKTKRLPDGPERNAVYRKMAEHRRRLQSVGSRRVPDREHARPAVGAGVQEAREHRARLEVPGPRPRAPAGGKVIRRTRSSLQQRDSRQPPVAQWRMRRLPRAASRRNIAIDNTRSSRGNMSIARPLLPLQSAIAVWTVARAGGALDCKGRSGIMHAIVPFPIYRGLTR